MTGAQALHLEALSAESPLLARVNLAILKAGGKISRCAASGALTLAAVTIFGAPWNDLELAHVEASGSEQGVMTPGC